jgi:monoamine oxidase
MSRPIDRREFLRHASATIAVIAAPPTRQLFTRLDARLTRAGAAQKIVVVGAGMAGLGAASELVARGHDVTILEARTRPGGRVLTLREPFADGLYAEAGAMQVFDVHARVQRYIQELGLELDPIRAPAVPLASVAHFVGKRIVTKAGESVQWPFALTDEEKSLDAGALYRKYVVPMLQPLNDAEAQDALLSSFGKYDRITFSDYLRAQGASPGAVAILKAGLAGGLGDGADHVSALNLLREAAHRSVRRQSFAIRGGTDRLPRGIAARLADRIHYGTPVLRLEQDANGVRVIAMQGGMRRTFTADRIVCAIPFSVLRRLEVSPAFTREKRTAVEQLQYTSVTRVFVQTRTRFWIDDGVSGNATTDLPVMAIYERTMNQGGARGILESYQAGANARVSMKLSERERLAAALDGMAKAYPRIVEQYEGGASKCWDEDEWSRGAYAWFKPGQMTALLPHIAGAEGRIHFAGEHASSSPGWMEGALESAERVTREIEAAARGVQNDA